MESMFEFIKNFTFKLADKSDPDHQNETSDEHSHGRDVVIESKIWYRDQYKRAVLFGIAVVSALIISLVFNIIQFFSTPPPRYFALTEDLRVVELTPTSKANLSQAKLLNWVSSTITKTFTFDFLNYRNVLMEVRPNYTSGCFKSLTGSLKSSGNLEMVTTKRLVTRAVLNGTPVIIKEGLIGGYRMWNIEVPLIISYEDSNGIVASQNLVGMAIVSREDERHVPRGVLIHQLVLKNR